MSTALNLTGQRFGRLVVLSRNYEKQYEIYKRSGTQNAYWNCQCDCGSLTVVSRRCLTNKKRPTISCGCYQNEVIHKQKNTKEIQWIHEGDITKGITNRGDEFIIDSEDFEKVKDYCWYMHKSGYIVAHSRDGKNSVIRLNRLIMGASDDVLVDHADWNKKDNRKSNLRIATKSQNNININRKSNNTSGYTGVRLTKNGKYTASISFDGKRYHLGTFGNFESAVKARHEAEKQYHGKWSGENNKRDYEKIMGVS